MESKLLNLSQKFYQFFGQKNIWVKVIGQKKYMGRNIFVKKTQENFA